MVHDGKVLPKTEVNAAFQQKVTFHVTMGQMAINAVVLMNVQNLVSWLKAEDWRISELQI